MRVVSMTVFAGNEESLDLSRWRCCLRLRVCMAEDDDERNCVLRWCDWLLASVAASCREDWQVKQDMPHVRMYIIQYSK